MSRPSRHGPKAQSQTYPVDKSGPNSTDAAAAAGLNKARAQFNAPLSQLLAIFPDWKDDDLVSVLEEVRGDVELAVARISEGHAEQWGAVKHKKDKKPTSNRERERERDGHGHHTSPRGASSSRGRGRGGARGSVQHSTSYRPQRDRATNGSSPAPAESAWATKESAPEATAIPENGLNAPNVETEDDSPAISLTHDTLAPSEAKPEDSVESTAAPLPSDDQKTAYGSTSAAKPRSKPGATGLSWAQIAKPVTKYIPPPQPSAPPKSVVVEPTPHVTQEPVPDIPEPVPEEPTTVEAPIWDDEPASQPLVPQLAPDSNADGWVDANPTSTKSEDSWTDLGNQQKPEPPSASQIPEPVPQEQQASAAPQIQHPTPEAFSPPPGLANPALSSPVPPKSSTPSNSRPAYGVHRPGSRYKSDQAVILPSQAPTAAAGFSMSKSIPLQFGSLNISGDDAESEPAAPELQPHAEQNSYSNNQLPATPAAPNHPNDTQPVSQPTYSPASAYGMQQPQQPQQAPQEELQAPSPAALSGPANTQAPPVNSALAMTPGPSTSFTQNHAVSSQHTLAGLTHTPQNPGPQSLSHSHHPSFSQQVSFPQQQPYDGASPAIGGAPFSGLGQSSQGQGQFFRQTDSPFYNQSHTPINEQHGFSGGGSGGFSGQGMQNFSGAPGLGNDFGYDGQRNPYDTYSSPTSFAGRGGLRQDEVKGLGGSSSQGLSTHHGSAQPSPLGGQPSGGQGQGQYPGMGHMGNYYYNMNMNPYGYANSFYAPPTFTSFVNPMYPAGGQTPPHGAKPGINPSSGIGASGNSAYSANNSGHLQHASGGFDSDGGPNGASTYHHATSTLPSDFQKGPYNVGGQGFLGSMGTSGGVGVNRGPGTAGVASGGVGPSASPETAFKGYGGNPASGLGPADKSLPTQAGRGAPGSNQGQQQFYQNNRYGNVPQSQGYPQQQQQQQQQQQGDSYYSNFQRW